ncbi:MAG TPA: zinc ribbon domain-containing protein [Ilumatobacteraceae bacterium]|jgi:hypothetical protein
MNAWDTFWAHVDDGSIRVPTCAVCATPNWYPTARCRNCAAAEFDWQVLSGEGEVFLAMPIFRDFAEDGRTVPYGVALFSPIEHPTLRMLARVVGDGLPNAGQTVRVTVAEIDGHHVPCIHMDAA